MCRRGASAEGRYSQDWAGPWGWPFPSGHRKKVIISWTRACVVSTIFLRVCMPYSCQIRLERFPVHNRSRVLAHIEKAEHQGCSGRITPESGQNRNPALDLGTPTNRNESQNVPPRGGVRSSIKTMPLEGKTAPSWWGCLCPCV